MLLKEIKMSSRFWNKLKDQSILINDENANEGYIGFYDGVPVIIDESVNTFETIPKD